jgi:hypothetical protein
MSAKKPQLPPPSSSGSSSTPKTPHIRTQIHRRNTVKGGPPYDTEWDVADGNQSTTLRTPADQMNRRASSAD